MKFTGLDNKIYTFNFNKQTRESTKSGLHLKAFNAIKKCFPYSSIYEDLTLYGCCLGGPPLIADFFITDFPALIEVHGEQHYKFSKFFHKNMAQFKKYVQNDKIKQEWCALNDVVYVELPFDKIKEWPKIIGESIE